MGEQIKRSAKKKEAGGNNGVVRVVAKEYKERKCATCPTILSRYNKGKMCSVCERKDFMKRGDKLAGKKRLQEW